MPVIQYTEYEPLPEGTYLFEIKQCDIKTAKTGAGGQYLQWILEVASDEEHAGEKLFYNTSMTLSAKSKLYKLVIACGVEGIEPGSAIDTDDFVGASLYGKVNVTEKTINNNKTPVNDIETFFSIAEFTAMMDKAAKAAANRAKLPARAPINASATVPPKNTTPTKSNTSVKPAASTKPNTSAKPAAPAKPLPRQKPADPVPDEEDENLQFPDGDAEEFPE